ncbi:MAG: hypothetical protein FGF53_06990, partial [Candidatus Brockarchaeota archaeon]|nr:hypothetical protein [Candidatus Brockarchaeota archaeon]
LKVLITYSKSLNYVPEHALFFQQALNILIQTGLFFARHTSASQLLKTFEGLGARKQGARQEAC